MSNDKRKRILNYIDKNWKGKKEDIDKMQEWISAGGERREVKEGDGRKTKVEDVIEDVLKEESPAESNMHFQRQRIPRFKEKNLR